MSKRINKWIFNMAAENKLIVSHLNLKKLNEACLFCVLELRE